MQSSVQPRLILIFKKHSKISNIIGPMPHPISYYSTHIHTHTAHTDSYHSKNCANAFILFMKSDKPVCDCYHSFCLSEIIEGIAYQCMLILKCKLLCIMLPIQSLTIMPLKRDFERKRFY